MITRCRIDGRQYSFDTEDERQTIGEGGEAVVVRWTPHAEFIRRHGNRRYAVKIFFDDTPEQRAAATMRQTKLRNVPRGVPHNVITPLDLVTDMRGQIIGYVMPLVEDVVPLVRLMDPKFRRQSGITQAHAVQVLTNLHATVLALHDAGVVIGDFNDKNILVSVKTGEVYVIDFDSAQWGRWPCLAATAEFSDPTLLDQSQNLRRGASYSKTSDWYSFAVIVYQLLTLSHPYRDGVHRPGPGKPRKRFPERVPIRLSVFNPDIHLDQSVHRPASLPDELGRFMRDVFNHDHRTSPFPIHLLTTFQWMTCPRCGRQHGRAICPNRECGAKGVVATQSQPRHAQPETPPSTAGQVPTATRQFIAAAQQGSRARYIYHESGAYRREDGTEVWQQAFSPQLSALVAGSRTVFCARSSFAIMNGDPRSAQQHSTDTQYGRATVATNSRHIYWVSSNSLVRDDGRLGTVTIGTIVPHMTSVWAGERFGLAMVQAGILTRVLVFDAERAGLYRAYNLPPEFGTVVDAQCVISDDLAWLVVSSRSRSGTVINRCYVLNASAQLLATAESRRGDGTWLGSMTPSALAVRDKLLAPVARTGIVRIGLSGGRLHQEGIYRGSAGIVASADVTVGLCLTTDGILHIGRQQISRISS